MDTVIAGFIGAVAALLGVVITQLFDIAKERAQDRRWYADYFLGLKIDTLVNLYSELFDWYDGIDLYATFPPSTLREFRERLESHHGAYRRLMVAAEIYMDEATALPIRTAYLAFQQANMAIWLMLPDDERQARVSPEQYDSQTRQVQRAEITTAFKSADSALKAQLNPKVLRKLP